jgi:hypothetical protein
MACRNGERIIVYPSDEWLIHAVVETLQLIDISGLIWQSDGM